ncbi:MAG: hypothetical protein ACHQJ7_04145 [Vicinamibacteria bacterium]
MAIVRGLAPTIVAICALLLPAAAQPSTSRSRSVGDASASLSSCMEGGDGSPDAASAAGACASAYD